jgi:predicted negative regulator of RcsB-dependent stress response
MKVERYGSLWAKHPMEAQLRITNCTARSVDEVKAKLARLNISTVQIIKNEAVAAARVLKHATGSTTHAEPEGELLLVHAKVDLSTKAVDFKFRAKNKMISDMASRFVSITMTDSAAN